MTLPEPTITTSQTQIAAAPTFRDGPFATARETAQDSARPTMTGRPLRDPRQTGHTRWARNTQAPGTCGSSLVQTDHALFLTTKSDIGTIVNSK